MVVNKTLRVASWNILFDTFPKTKTKTQKERCKELTKTLRELGGLDILGLYEVESDGVDDCGQAIAKDLGLKHTTRAEQGRPSEGILLASKPVLKNIRILNLDPERAGRQAIIGTYGDITIVVLHLIAQVRKQPWRTKQIKRLVEEIGNADKAIVMGDFNCLPSNKPRRLLEDNGYASCMKLLEMHKVSTFPTNTYRDISVHGWRKRLIPHGLAIDDIYIKNLKLVDGGMFEGNSDHYGLWANILLSK